MNKLIFELLKLHLLNKNIKITYTDSGVSIKGKYVPEFKTVFGVCTNIEIFYEQYECTKYGIQIDNALKIIVYGEEIKNIELAG